MGEGAESMIELETENERLRGAEGENEVKGVA